MANWTPNRVATGKAGAGRYDFKHNSEANLDLIDYESAVDDLISQVGAPQLRVGGGNISNDRSYLRAIDAIDRAETTEEMALALQGLLRGRGRVSGFSTSRLNLENTRELTRTLADLFTKYPTVNADVSIVNIWQKSVYAQALATRKRGEKDYSKLEIQISRSQLRKGPELNEVFEEGKESGWVHLVNDKVSPMRYTVTHEFGHLMEYSSSEPKSHEIQAAYAADHGHAAHDTPEMQQYFTDNSSLYGQTSSGELLAEAFADVECNGNDAFGYSKFIHTRLVGEVNAKACLNSTDRFDHYPEDTHNE
jgi:hypothetical protein